LERKHRAASVVLTNRTNRLKVLLDEQKNKQKLTGKLKPREARAFRVEKPVALSNKGGLVSISEHS